MIFSKGSMLNNLQPLQTITKELRREMFITLGSESVKVFPEQRLTLSPSEKQKIRGEKREVFNLNSMKIKMRNESFQPISSDFEENEKKGQKKKSHSEFSIFTKFTILKYHFQQNSQFQNIIFDKTHISKISYLTKFTFQKSHI